jgi:hypothetical protein
MEPQEIPELQRYITVAALAEMYEVDKGTIYYMLYNQSAFSRVYKVMKGVNDERPLILLNRLNAVAVMDERKKRLEAGGPRASTAQEQREWNRRVKDWGHSIGWSESRISRQGRPGQQLVDAYLRENPDDPQPGTQGVADSN